MQILGDFMADAREETAAEEGECEEATEARIRAGVEKKLINTVN